jgi:hypothetical protein
MTDKDRELYEAAKALLPFLKASTDDFKLDPLTWLRQTKAPEGETPAQRLRREAEAEAIEAKDAAIQRFRAAVAAFEPPSEHQDLDSAIRAATELGKEY